MTSTPITEGIKHRIYNVSFLPQGPISLDELRYVVVPIYTFEGNVEEGELIVHRDVDQEVIEIFKELVEKKFPLKKMKLIDDYNADDIQSMTDNNSSALCVRRKTGKTEWSNHSFGRALDINPLLNPYVRDTRVLPYEGQPYLEKRRQSVWEPGMIQRGDACYDAFVRRGWEWGGDWGPVRGYWDYHHFEKPV
eukprot:gb/GECH01006606.1/.p1 GENE.gb/GECH01006606.1/~~gb/GECH01006606.1/.p1  ORF type:complete len:193 (+),score=43.32 gb/GECH01006606.1/:1-579(+)